MLISIYPKSPSPGMPPTLSMKVAEIGPCCARIISANGAIIVPRARQVQGGFELCIDTPPFGVVLAEGGPVPLWTGKRSDELA